MGVHACVCVCVCVVLCVCVCVCACVCVCVCVWPRASYLFVFGMILIFLVSFCGRHLELNKVHNMMHFKEEVWSYFAMGVQLQELYIRCVFELRTT